MFPSIIDSAADQATTIYKGFTNVLTAEFARTIELADPTTGSARAKMKQTVALESGMTLGRLKSMLDGAFLSVAVEALQGRRSDPIAQAVLDHTSALQDDLLEILGVCVTRDGTVPVAALQKLALSVSLATNKTSAIIASRRDAVTNLKFRQIDRLGRQWMVENFIIATVRGALLNAYNDAVVIALSMEDTDLARIDVDGSPGATFSISGKQKAFPSYLEDIRPSLSPVGRSIVVPV